MTGFKNNALQTPARAVTCFLLLAAALLLAVPAFAVHGNAVIQGLTGTSFDLVAKAGYVRTGDGGSVHIWGYAEGFGDVQYPGPTLIVNQGEAITITLRSQLPQATSLVIPGFDVTATGGNPGLLTREAPPDRVTTVTYSFTADRPGTFLYSSGTNADVQVEMGLVGALIVRPSGFDQVLNRTAYGDASSAYDHEYLFLMTSMDPLIHELAEAGRFDEIETHDYFPVYWFLNGRTGPDTMMPDYIPWLPTQPYSAFAMINVRDRMLMRVLGAGHDAHPFHTHGNNFDQIARDGWPLETAAGAARNAEVGTIPDLAVSNFTLNTLPGATFDTIFTWTGYGLGWDMYGHDGSEVGICDGSNEAVDPTTGESYDLATHEFCADHTKPFPTVLPFQGDLAFGAFYSGSPFLGAAGSLPPGEGGNNPNAGFAFMWHSHNEKELTNNDIFPGGMMTMMIIEAPAGP